MRKISPIFFGSPASTATGKLWLPSKQILEPNLLVPKKKPVGNVKIDWNHPLANGLIACWIFQDNTGRDLTGNYNGINESPSTIVTAPDREGMAIKNPTDSTSNKIDLGNITSADSLSGCVTGKLSCYVHTYISSTGNSTYPRWIDKSDGGSAANGWALYYDLPSNNITYAQSGNNIGIIDLSGRENKTYGVGFSADPSASGGDELWGYLNGVQEYVKGSGASPVLAAYQTTTTEAGLLNWNHTTDRQYQEAVYCIYVWDRLLSDEDHKNIHSDPYQFLKPAGLDSYLFLNTEESVTPPAADNSVPWMSFF